MSGAVIRDITRRSSFLLNVLRSEAVSCGPIRPTVTGSQSRAAASLLLSRSFNTTNQNLEAQQPVLRAATPKGKATEWQKRRLVWAKMYPTMADVPDAITETKMKKANDIMRIRTANVMVVLFLIMAYFAIRSGRKARNEGDSFTKRGNEAYAKQQRIGQEKRAREAEELEAAQLETKAT